jgi:hypothetical protein
MSNRKLLLSILIIFTHNLWAHDHLDYNSGEIRIIYDDIYTSLEAPYRTNAGTVELRSYDGRRFFINEDKLTSLVRSSLLINRDIILGHCEEVVACSPKKIKKKFDFNLKRLTKTSVEKIKAAGFFLQDFVMDLLWDSVTGVRRYGALYFALIATGEVIEHAIIHPLGIPIPLCKFVQAGTVKILSGAKRSALILFGKHPGGLGASERMRTLVKDYQFRSSYIKHINRFLAYSADPSRINMTRWQKVKAVFKKENYFQKTNRDFYLHTVLENPNLTINEEMKVFDTNKPVEAQVLKLKMERKIQSLNFLIETNEMYLKAMFEEEHINWKQYAKAKWRLGALAAELDKFHVSLIAINRGNLEQFLDPKIKNVTDKFLVHLKEFSNDPTSSKFKSNFSKLKSIIGSIKKTDCGMYFMLNRL